MKNCIITQAKDQSARIKDWILYHYEEGFDTFIYFDDYSTDNSIEILEKIKIDYGINIIINFSDAIGNTIQTSQMSNSNSYAGDSTVNYRIIRSYNRGLEIAKSSNINSICAFIDIDEFITSDSLNSIEMITKLLEEKNTKHLYLASFDVQDDWLVQDWYTTDKNTRLRWDFDSRQSSPYRYRGKSVCLASAIEEIKQEPNYVHCLVHCNEEYANQISVTDHTSLRIHHYRKPILSNSIEFVEDFTIINKMLSIKEKYKIKK